MQRVSECFTRAIRETRENSSSVDDPHAAHLGPAIVIHDSLREWRLAGTEDENRQPNGGLSVEVRKKCMIYDPHS
ncbi:hypothetical protein E2C01_099810 [Portunus trituberculatus]|uniref:Uncharacterized protein n=1 Tax=Portunus trituberculatus TaxID=210409 RepID=A0A5B7KBV9_PORTR|nr:hypothetical protein [Portunus trituberculatus]